MRQEKPASAENLMGSLAGLISDHIALIMRKGKTLASFKETFVDTLLREDVMADSRSVIPGSEPRG